MRPPSSGRSATSAADRTPGTARRARATSSSAKAGPVVSLYAASERSSITTSTLAWSKPGSMLAARPSARMNSPAGHHQQQRHRHLADEERAAQAQPAADGSRRRPSAPARDRAATPAAPARARDTIAAPSDNTIANASTRQSIGMSRPIGTGSCGSTASSSRVSQRLSSTPRTHRRREQQRRFGEQLPRQPPARRADRQPHGDLAPARRRRARAACRTGSRRQSSSTSPTIADAAARGTRRRRRCVRGSPRDGIAVSPLPRFSSGNSRSSAAPIDDQLGVRLRHGHARLQAAAHDDSHTRVALLQQRRAAPRRRERASTRSAPRRRFA